MYIWMNLLDNAIKFSPAKGTIMMFLKQEKDSVKMCIRDRMENMKSHCIHLVVMLLKVSIIIILMKIIRSVR